MLLRKGGGAAALTFVPNVHATIGLPQASLFPRVKIHDDGYERNGHNTNLYFPW